MEIQWFIAFCSMCIAFGFLVGYLLQGKTVGQTMTQLNGFMDIMRGEKNKPVDNLRFLIAHLREGGPKDLAKLFQNETLKNISASDIDKALGLLDSDMIDAVLEASDTKLGNLK